MAKSDQLEILFSVHIAVCNLYKYLNIALKVVEY